MQAAKEKYPEAASGDMLLKIGEQDKPVDCMRVMLQKIRSCPVGRINSPQDVVAILREMQNIDRERAMILHLDTKNNIVGVENISTGSLNASIVHPREAIKGAILNNSSHIIFAHNHPSGDPAPSAEDLAINKKLMGAFDAVGIDMLDSIIIGKSGYYSAKEHGYMFPESKYKESKSGDKIMESKGSSKIEIELEQEDDACSVATQAAMSVISEQCSGAEADEPEQGRFLRLQIKQEIKHIHALALGTVTHPGHTAQSYTQHTITLIETGVESELISPEFADVLKRAVQKAIAEYEY